jgi:acyl-CoA thioester hydrolase
VTTAESDRLPPDLHAFQSFVRVRFHEVDSLGHVNNAAYLNYLEQAAIDHATYLGLDIERLHALGGVFVARRHDIVFLRPAFAGDLLRIVTWLDEPRGARVSRNYRVIRELDPARSVPAAGAPLTAGYDIPDDQLVVRATTEWVFAGPNGMPKRLPAEVIELFHTGSALPNSPHSQPMQDQRN